MYQRVDPTIEPSRQPLVRESTEREIFIRKGEGTVSKLEFYNRD